MSVIRVPIAAENLIRMVILLRNLKILACRWISDFYDESSVFCTRHAKVLRIHLVPDDAERLSLGYRSDMTNLLVFKGLVYDQVSIDS